MDDLDAYVRDRSRINPDFPALVDAARDRRHRPPPADETQLAELARLTPAERFRRAVLSARNLAPFLGKDRGPWAGPDQLPG